MEKVAVTAVFMLGVVALTPFIMTFLYANVSSALTAYRQIQSIQSFANHLRVGAVFVSDGIYVTIDCPETLQLRGVIVKYFNGSVIARNASSLAVNWSFFNRTLGSWVVTNFVFNGTYFYRLVVPDYVNVTYVLLVTNESGKVIGFSVV